MELWSSQPVDSNGGSTVIKIKRVVEDKERQGTKRKSSSTSSPESKKSKMNNEEFRSILAETIRESSAANQAALDETKKEILSAIDTKISPIASDVAELKSQYSSMQVSTDNQGQDIDKLREEMKEMKESFDKKVMKVVGDKGTASDSSSYKITLATIIDKANKNLIIHGLKTDKPMDDVQALFSSLKLPASIQTNIVSVVQLGKGDGVKTPSIMVSLQNQFQRNDLLKAAKNLPAGVSFDRDIPQGYREAYKRMRRQAWKYRNLFEVQTQIIFTGHQLQLRYKDIEEGSKKAYTILEEFYPKPEHLVTPNSGNSVKPGTHPSTSISKDALERARNKMIMTGIGKRDKSEVDTLLKDILKTQEYDAIAKVDILRGNAVIEMSSPTIGRQIVSKYNSILSKEHKISLETI